VGRARVIAFTLALWLVPGALATWLARAARNWSELLIPPYSGTREASDCLARMLTPVGIARTLSLGQALRSTDKRCALLAQLCQASHARAREGHKNS